MLLARERKLTRFDSGADSIVWMKEDKVINVFMFPGVCIQGIFYFEGVFYEILIMIPSM